MKITIELKFNLLDRVECSRSDLTALPFSGEIIGFSYSLSKDGTSRIYDVVSDYDGYEHKVNEKDIKSLISSYKSK